MIITTIVFTSLVLLILADLLPKPPKSTEQEFGEAVIKYLSKGVKVRIEKNDD